MREPALAATSNTSQAGLSGLGDRALAARWRELPLAALAAILSWQNEYRCIEAMAGHSQIGKTK